MSDDSTLYILIEFVLAIQMQCLYVNISKAKKDLMIFYVSKYRNLTKLQIIKVSLIYNS